MAQGDTRLARGLAFAQTVNEKLNAGHHVVEVELCGHNPRCMFTADSALPVLFPALSQSASSQTAKPRPASAGSRD